MVVPTGTVISYLGQEGNLNALESQGWLNCDGSSVSSDDYPDLWSAIGNAYGTTGEGQFNLPDLRGMFLRGVDPTGVVDPDYSTRLSPDPSGAGTGGPVVGSRQGHQLLNHQHNWDQNFGSIGWDGSDINVQLTSNSPNGGNQGSLPTTDTDGGGAETRSVNVYAYFLIYAASSSDSSRRHRHES